ncbi:hypothetical protein BDW75DRAFT_102987 [Aspergillus navahoensis]
MDMDTVSGLHLACLMDCILTTFLLLPFFPCNFFHSVFSLQFLSFPLLFPLLHLHYCIGVWTHLGLFLAWRASHSRVSSAFLWQYSLGSVPLYCSGRQRWIYTMLLLCTIIRLAFVPLSTFCIQYFGTRRLFR